LIPVKDLAKYDKVPQVEEVEVGDEEFGEEFASGSMAKQQGRQLTLVYFMFLAEAWVLSSRQNLVQVPNVELLASWLRVYNRSFKCSLQTTNIAVLYPRRISGVFSTVRTLLVAQLESSGAIFPTGLDDAGSRYSDCGPCSCVA
jgi:hypothetical protein